MKRLYILFLVSGAMLVSAQEPVMFTANLSAEFAPSPPTLAYAAAGALLDYETKTLLYGVNHQQTWAPASLTKLVTVYAALDAHAKGAFSLYEPQPVHPEAWASAMMPGSSLMFLGPDQVVSGADLFRGLLISSGNDAATEIAYRVSGSVGRFARRMNTVAATAGFPDFYFEEPAGLSPTNRITAEGFARFAALLIDRYPEILTDYASLPSFAYPQQQHYPDGVIQGNPIVQYNRNALIDDYPGADGLKTGFIDESGYNLVGTAERNGRRLIVVVLGVSATSHAEGGARRADDARRLLDWGFDNYRRVEFGAPELAAIPVWGGTVDEIVPAAAPVNGVVVPADAVSAIERSVSVDSHVWAPQEAGAAVGNASYHVGETVIVEQRIVIPRPLERGSWLVRVWDRLRWWAHALRQRLAGNTAVAFSSSQTR